MYNKKFYLFSIVPNDGKHFIREDTGACYHREDGAFFSTKAEAEAFARSMYPRDAPHIWAFDLEIRYIK